MFDIQSNVLALLPLPLSQCSIDGHLSSAICKLLTAIMTFFQNLDENTKQRSIFANHKFQNHRKYKAAGLHYQYSLLSTCLAAAPFLGVIVYLTVINCGYRYDKCRHYKPKLRLYAFLLRISTYDARHRYYSQPNYILDKSQKAYYYSAKNCQLFVLLRSYERLAWCQTLFATEYSCHNIKNQTFFRTSLPKSSEHTRKKCSYHFTAWPSPFMYTFLSNNLHVADNAATHALQHYLQ